MEPGLAKLIIFISLAVRSVCCSEIGNKKLTSMSIDANWIRILSDAATSSTFKLVTRKRKVRFDDLMRDLDTDDETLVIDQLERLKIAGLIEHRGSFLPEWGIYIVTADGLQAARKI